MKFKECPGYNKNTEIEKVEIGTAYGEVLYSEKEVILYEYCSIYDKINDFDCEKCPVYLTRLSEKEGKKDA